MKYKFQIKTGNISDGYNVIDINDYEAEIKEMTPALELLVQSHGGQVVKAKKKAKKQEVKDGSTSS